MLAEIILSYLTILNLILVMVNYINPNTGRIYTRVHNGWDENVKLSCKKL